MNTLEGRSYVVAGGAGGVGEGIVRALLGAGARVVVPSRERSRLEALRTLVTRDETHAPEMARLELVETDVGDVTQCERLRDEQIRRHGPLHGVVSAVGGWWQGAHLAHVPVDDWDRVLRNNLRTPWILARTFVDALHATPGATYTVINGSAALEPVIDAGPSSIASAAMLMMSRTLAAEAKGTRLRVNTLVLGPVRTRNTRGPGMPEWLTADEVGAYVAHLVSDAGRMVSGAVVNLFERPSPGGPGGP
jgi:3-oxoacyl-[acyl-carrier protein] reductase